MNAVSRAPGMSLRDSTERAFAVVALDTMVDGVLRRVFVERDPNVPHRVLSNDPRQVARYLTRIWIRSLFGREFVAPK